MEKENNRKHNTVMLIRNCGTCRYWQPDGQAWSWSGTCNRPGMNTDNRNREIDDWCPYHEARNA